MNVRLRLPRLHAAQREIWEARGRYNVVCLGRRSGKTAMGTLLALGASADGDLGPGAIQGKPVGWFAPTYRIMEPAWKEAKQRLAPLVRGKNESTKTLELVTGGILEFWSLEDANVGRSRKYARVIIDEAAMVRNFREAWEQSIRPTLTDLAGDAWFLSTPKGQNYFWDLWQRGAGTDHEAWRAWQLPTSCNPFINADEIEEARLSLPELVFAQEYEAKFVSFGVGLVKPEYIVDGPAPAGLPVVLGVDLAISEKQTSDWTAIVAASRDPTTGIIYKREVERHRAGFNEVLNRIKAAAARWNPTLIAVEQTQYQAAVVQELARTTALPVRGIRPDRDKLTRFAPLLTRYEQGLVRHDPSGVPAWFREELLAFPEGEHDDGVDAAAYAFNALWQGAGGFASAGRRLF